MTNEVKRLERAEIEITITVDAARVQEEYQRLLHHVAQDLEIEGFRKGTAPLELVKQKVDKNKLYGEIINHLLPQAYSSALTEHHLKPIINPQIEIIQFEPEEVDKDLIFKAKTAEAPPAELGDYKSRIKEAAAKFKSSAPEGSIVGPDGKPLIEKPDKTDITIDQIIEAVCDGAQVELPSIIVENEVNRMLSALIDQTSRLGLTIEQYLHAEGKTVDQLKEEYRKEAQNTLKTEFILEEIAKLENIDVGDDEIEKALSATDSESQKELAKDANRWYIRAVIRRNKIFERLFNYAKNNGN